MNDNVSTSALFDRMSRIRAALPTEEQIRRDREITEKAFKLAEVADRLFAAWMHLFGRKGVIG